MAPYDVLLQLDKTQFRYEGNNLIHWTSSVRAGKVSFSVTRLSKKLCVCCDIMDCLLKIIAFVKTVLWWPFKYSNRHRNYNNSSKTCCYKFADNCLVLSYFHFIDWCFHFIHWVRSFSNIRYSQMIMEYFPPSMESLR